MSNSDIKIEIDPLSGFCFGVTTSINKAEAELAKSGHLYCLGDIVHNNEEVERLRSNGLVTITHEEMEQLHDVKVLLRAHGEPPSTYELARRNNIEIIDATCPVVLQLQRRIKAAYDKTKENIDNRTQIVIYGKAGHAEVNGLVGQTDGNAIVIDDPSSLNEINFKRPIKLYSQTTKSLEGWRDMVERISIMKSPDTRFEYFDTICRQVSGRVNHLREFAATHDVVLFVSGVKSSNGKVLYNVCRTVNARTHMISDCEQIDAEWLSEAHSIGICGATSTPLWLMEKVRDAAHNIVEAQ